MEITLKVLAGGMQFIFFNHGNEACKLGCNPHNYVGVFSYDWNCTPKTCVKLDPILKTLSAALSRAASSLDQAESNFKAQSKRTEYIELASFDYIGLRVD